MGWFGTAEGYEGFLAFCAAAWALVAGFFLWCGVESIRRKARHRSALRESGARGSESSDGVPRHRSLSGSSIASSLNERVIADMELQSTRMGLRKDRGISLPSWAKTKWITKNARCAGLDGFVTEEGFVSTRIRFALVGSAVGAVVGFVISPEMAALLGLVGLMAGWALPKRMVGQRALYRAQEMEHHLPEMLDVVALGMRSGLSFDESLKMYSSHFKTMLSGELANAQRRWSSGLERRDEALRKVAASYDSSVFGRVVETIIRSIRFGSSMVESLEAASTEARNAYKTRREEEVAKAPVKMMIPTGTLILPAMLILVLGPVLLELAGGGF